MLYICIMKNLSSRIYKFLDKYAAISPNWDEEYDLDEEKYTSPDASEIRTCADLLSQDIIPDKCYSDWESGGYKPYSSKEGREEHDLLISEIYKIISDGKY